MPQKLSKLEIARLIAKNPDASDEDILQMVRERNADDRTPIGKAADTIVPLALRLLGAIGGGIAGGAAASPTVAGIPVGVMAGGAAGAGLGEELAEGYEQLRGQRQGFNPAQIATQATLGGIPIVGRASSVAKTALNRAAQGALIGGVGSVGSAYAEGEKPGLFELVTGGVLGAGLGAGAGAVEAKVAQKLSPFLNAERFTNVENTPLLKDEYGIVSWANPGKTLTPEQNALRQKLLEKELRGAGYDPITQEGHFGGEPEPSFLVPGMPAEKVKEFGRKGALPGERQTSVMSKAGYHRLEDDATFPYQGVEFNQDVPTNYSSVRLPGGRQVKYQLGVPDEAFGAPQTIAEQSPSALPHGLDRAEVSSGQLTKSLPSQQLTPSQEAKQVAEEMLELEHRSTTGGLKSIDPSFYKPSRAEAARRDAGDASEFLPRSYWTTKGGFVESRFKGAPHTYRAKAAPTKVYDFSEDPLKLIEEGQKAFPTSPQQAATRFEKLAYDKGYRGYRWSKHENPMFRDTVAMFEPLEVAEDVAPQAGKTGTIGGTKAFGALGTSLALYPGKFSEDPEKDKRIREVLGTAGLVSVGMAGFFPKKLGQELQVLQAKTIQRLRAQGLVNQDAKVDQVIKKALLGKFDDPKQAKFMYQAFKTIELPDNYEGVNFDKRGPLHMLLMKDKDGGVRLSKFSQQRLEKAYEVGQQREMTWGQPEWIAALTNYDPEHATKFARLLGAFSPATPTNQNLQMAAEMFIRGVLRGEDPEVVIKSMQSASPMYPKNVLPNVKRAIQGGRIYSEKTENLSGAELGLKHRIPIDVWLLRAMGSIDEISPGSLKTYYGLEDGFGKWAASKGQDPFTVMATVWEGMQEIAGVHSLSYQQLAKNMGLPANLVHPKSQEYVMQNIGSMSKRIGKSRKEVGDLSIELPPPPKVPTPEGNPEEFMNRVRDVVVRGRKGGDVLGIKREPKTHKIPRRY